MSLITELDISLKDLFPLSDDVIEVRVHDQSRGSAIISSSLYERVQRYAAKHQLSSEEVV